MALAQFESDGVTRALGLTGSTERVSASSPTAALALVASGDVDGAVVPIESSVEGSVPPTLDALATGNRLQIVSETELDVAFTILGRPGVALADVKTIRAYSIAAGQVRLWIEKNLPDAEVQFASSNAGAAEDVAAGLADAAVSTGLAGERLKLPVLADGVADVEGARTRFVFVTLPRASLARTGADRTAVVLMPDNRPGALLAALSEFGIRDIDLTRIESRPTRTEFGTYRFYVDCVGHIDDPLVAETLTALHRKMKVRFLGSWPTATAAGRTPPAIGEHVDWLNGLRVGEVDH